jgi:hypothetical protein
LAGISMHPPSSIDSICSVFWGSKIGQNSMQGLRELLGRVLQLDST